MAISVQLAAKARTIEGVEGWPYRAVADAMEVIPRTLVQNAGGNAIRVLTELRVGHVLICLRNQLLMNHHRGRQSMPTASTLGGLTGRRGRSWT